MHKKKSMNGMYLKQPVVLVRAVSHSKCLGLQVSSPPSCPLSQPECGTMTSSDRACSAWSTISIFTESCDERFHSVPGGEDGRCDCGTLDKTLKLRFDNVVYVKT